MIKRFILTFIIFASYQFPQFNSLASPINIIDLPQIQKGSSEDDKPDFGIRALQNAQIIENDGKKLIRLGVPNGKGSPAALIVLPPKLVNSDFCISGKVLLKVGYTKFILKSSNKANKTELGLGISLKGQCLPIGGGDEAKLPSLEEGNPFVFSITLSPSTRSFSIKIGGEEAKSFPWPAKLDSIGELWITSASRTGFPTANEIQKLEISPVSH